MQPSSLPGGLIVLKAMSSRESWTGSIGMVCKSSLVAARGRCRPKPQISLVLLALAPARKQMTQHHCLNSGKACQQPRAWPGIGPGDDLVLDSETGGLLR